MKRTLILAICAGLVAPLGLAGPMAHMKVGGPVADLQWAGPVAPGTTVVQTDSNGVSLNGVRHNRIAINRIATNRLAANKLAANRIALNKLSANASGFGDATPLVAVRGVTLADGRVVAVDPAR